MLDNRQRSFITPLSIDELPMVFKLNEEGAPDPLPFDCVADRWSVADLWGGTAEPLVPGLPGVFNFPKEQILAAERMIRTDVGWRDRRLVQQSNSLAIVCPKPPGEDRITRGVMDEVDTAVAVGTVCHLWQKPEWDQTNFVGNFFGQAGSMGISQTQALVKQVTTLDDLIRANP
jgi:hypothetical protein